MLSFQLSPIVKRFAYNTCDVLESFIKEIGLPTRWNEIGVTDEEILRKSADVTVLTVGCCKRFTHDELFDVLKETI